MKSHLLRDNFYFSFTSLFSNKIKKLLDIMSISIKYTTRKRYIFNSSITTENNSVRNTKSKSDSYSIGNNIPGRTSKYSRHNLLSMTGPLKLIFLSEINLQSAAKLRRLDGWLFPMENPSEIA